MLVGLPPLEVNLHALTRLRSHLASLLVAYLLICGPGIALSSSGALAFLGEWGSPILFAFLLPLLDTVLLLQLSRPGSRWPHLLRALPAAYLCLLLARLLRSLVLGAVALSLVLIPPVLAWLWLAEVIAVDEACRNPLACLNRSRERVRGHTLEVLLCLLPLGLPAVAGSVGLWLCPEDALPAWAIQLSNVLVDWLGLGLTAVAFELNRGLRAPRARASP